MAAAGAIGAGDVLDGVNVKFLAPVRPGDRVRVSWRPGDDGTIRFECTVGDNRVASGAFRAVPPSTAAGPDPAGRAG